MAPYDGRPWPRRPHTLTGAWSAIEDLREEVDRMGNADVIAEAVQQGMRKERSRWLTTGRGVFVLCCGAVTTLAAVATAAHSWIGG